MSDMRPVWILVAFAAYLGWWMFVWLACKLLAAVLLWSDMRPVWILVAFAAYLGWWMFVWLTCKLLAAINCG